MSRPEASSRRDYMTQDWETKLRFRPTREQVRKLLATHGADGCRERWGRQASDLIREARF